MFPFEKNRDDHKIITYYPTSDLLWWHHATTIPDRRPRGAAALVIRGIERRKIFQDDADRENFLDRLGRILAETSTACYGWALLSNHVHLYYSRCRRSSVSSWRGQAVILSSTG